MCKGVIMGPLCRLRINRVPLRDDEGEGNMYKKILILAGALVLLSSCGAKKTDAPAATEATSAATEATTVSEETSAETTTTAAEAQPAEAAPEETTTTAAPDELNEDVFQGGGFVSFSMPEITVSMPDISLPDMTPPDIEEFMGEYLPATEPAAETEQSETAATTVTEEQKAEPIETEVSDNGFVYNGKVVEIGDDEHGYIMVPADAYRFYDDTATNVIQYAIDGPINIITIKHLPGVGSYNAAQGIMKGIDDKGIVQGLTGATVKLGDYDAYQIYGLYPDGVYEIIWVTEDKNDPDNSYYICFELDADHMNDLALAQTYKMPADHK